MVKLIRRTLQDFRKRLKQEGLYVEKVSKELTDYGSEWGITAHDGVFGQCVEIKVTKLCCEEYDSNITDCHAWEFRIEGSAGTIFSVVPHNFSKCLWIPNKDRTASKLRLEETLADVYPDDRLIESILLGLKGLQE